MPEQITYPELRDVCEEAARVGAEKLVALRGEFSCSQKAPKDLVTSADLASERAIRELVTRKYPSHGFLGEEQPDWKQLEEEYCWVVDPMDGTLNFVHGLPYYAVSIAVCHRGRVVAGAILDPNHDECYLAAEGEGCTLNGRRVTTSDTEELSDALVAVSFPVGVVQDSPDIASFLKVSPKCQAVRRIGSAALNLAYVACGRLDAHWAHDLFPWDAAAGVLMVSEAGGIVTASSGKEFRLARPNYLVAGNRPLYDAMLELVGPHAPE